MVEDLQPAQILGRRMVKKHNQTAVQLLVHWVGCPAEEATWVDYSDFIVKYPSFDVSS